MLLSDIQRRLDPPNYLRHRGLDEPSQIRHPESEPEPDDEPELLRELTRIHEASHIVLAHVGGLRVEGAKSARGNASVRLNVPSGTQAAVSYMITLTGSRAAQRKFGATDEYYEQGCAEDDRQIENMARKLAKTEHDVDRIIGAVEREAERLVNRHWTDIKYIAGALRKLEDYADEPELDLLLRDVRAAPAVQARSAPPVDEPLEVDSVPFRRRCDGYLRAA
jgi:hypothetical protein